MYDSKIIFLDDKQIPTCIEILDNKISKPFDLNSFIIYSEQLYCTENVLLWLDIQKFKKVENDNLIFLKRIYDIYLKKDSYMEVNLTSYKSMKTKKLIKDIIDKKEKGMNNKIFYYIELELISNISCNLYISFVNNIIIQKRLLLAEKEALWWKNDITFKRFFSFPNPINEADSRIHNICSLLLFLISFLFDRLLNFQFIYILLIYGFLIRVLCGPKLDPQAFLVLFILRPIFSNKFNFILTKFVPGPPKRFSQFIGLCFVVLGTTLRYIYLFTVYKNNIILYFEYSIWLLYLIASFFAGFLNLCFACKIFILLIYLKIIPKNICKECQIKYMI